MAVLTRTNERPGTRAQVRHARMSATKAREVLDLIRGLPVGEAADVLRYTERGAATVIERCLSSAVANAQHNDELDPDTLYVATCYADEGPTLKRWRPRARGRATRIRKRMCHITIIVSPMPAEMAAKVEARQAASGAAAPAGRRGRRAQESRRARVARSRGETVTETPEDETPVDEVVEEAEAEFTDDESLDEDETTEARGVDSAGGGDAEGGASTKADNDTDEAPSDDAEEKK